MDAFFSEGGILLPDGMAPDVRVGDTVQFDNRSWTVRGAFDPRKLRAAKEST